MSYQFKFYNMENTLNKLFEEQVYKTPDRIAVLHKDSHFTYEELNKRANKLAYYLQEFGVKPEVLVGICFERSIDMIIGIIGILKAGGAYLSIDPICPEERLEFILRDSKVTILVTLNDFINKFNNYGGITVRLDKDWHQISKRKEINPLCFSVSNNIAYVVYTSGTTGEPKGVCGIHSAIINRFYWMWRNYPFIENDVFCQKTSPNFVDFIWELFGPLLQGIKSIIFDRNIVNDSQLLNNNVEKYYITHLVMVPSLIEQFVINDQFNFLFLLRQLNLSGEKLSNKLMRALNNINSGIILNLYGSSEIAADVSYFDIRNIPYDSNASIIGQAIENIYIYILDKDMNFIDRGMSGEIYVGGLGLARGYLNKPELTAEKFIANPFQTKEQRDLKQNSRLYRTGDMGRYLVDGNIEYLGRSDSQLKIRGYRIESGEIEAALLSYPGIEYSTVIAKEYSNNSFVENKYLVAYYLRKIHLEGSDADDFINSWNILYQSEYSSLNANDCNYNIELWKSSYTGKAIPKKDMLEWIDSTVSRIKKLNPKIILEIGSGSGLILFNVIDYCYYYYASDFSKKAIDYTKQVINKLGYNDKVTTFVSKANELPYNRLDKQYDTVVINSVTQYFPSLDYLQDIINKIILNTNNSPSQIFIGDIRDYRLLEYFHYSVQSYKNKSLTKRQVEFFCNRDKELLISPEYFIYLQSINEHISYVEVMPKLGIANNEMNNYRYDVVLHINKSTENYKNQQIIFDIKDDTFTKVHDLEEYFRSTINNDFLFIKYPNTRIMHDYFGYAKFYSKSAIKSYGSEDFLPLDEIIKQIEERNYNYKCFLDVYDPLYYNIIISKSIDNKEICLNYLFKKKLSKTTFSNNPLMNSKLIDNKFTKQLQEYLSRKLPEYMMPLYYVPLENLPLTVNGKLDKSALPDPEFNNFYAPPTNQLESKLCKVYASVLGLPEGIIGISDEFLKLGGNSLLAIKLIKQVNKEFHINISVASILEYTTIERLSCYISKTLSNFNIVDEGTI